MATFACPLRAQLESCRRHKPSRGCCASRRLSRGPRSWPARRAQVSRIARDVIVWGVIKQIEGKGFEDVFSERGDDRVLLDEFLYLGCGHDLEPLEEHRLGYSALIEILLHDVHGHVEVVQ